MDQLKDTIREFIVSNYLPGESLENLRDDTPLLSSGILDSLAALGLISFIEKKYGVELDVYDTSIEQFDRIEDIARSVGRKAQA
jgi:acyl carrier protein